MRINSLAHPASSEAEVRLILVYIVYKFNRRPLNYPYHVHQPSIRISRLTDTNPRYGLLPSTWVFSRPTGNTMSHSTRCAYWLQHLYWNT